MNSSVPPGLPPGAVFSPRAVPGMRILGPARPPAAGEVLLGYYVLKKTGGCFQCADLSFCGCFWCTFFSCWFVTMPISCLICLTPSCHTGLQFPVYGPPPAGHNFQAWQGGPPPDYQYPAGYMPPPPPNLGVPGPTMLPAQFPGQQNWAPPPAMGVPTSTNAPQQQEMAMKPTTM